ncbi:flagellin [Paenibacillus sp. 2TAB26]|uniref:flagellin N-terminal helical domain-containing protein n=1 Tax=Paenibacillus sp. 2TAB26 TaxID=3233005 RepID=UPI003F9568DD
MIINNNPSAINAHNSLKKNNIQTSKASEKLSSGLRINRAADDAAGLAISEKMRAQIRGLDQAYKNVQNGISLIQTAESGYQEITDIIQRQRELIIQGMNDTNTFEDKQKIDQEIQQLKEEINKIATQTEFNTINLLGRDDFQILADRSSHTIKVNTSGPFLPTTIINERTTSFFPIGMTEVPVTAQSSNTSTTIGNVNNFSASVTPITSPDGREGYNNYEKNEHIHTETTTTGTYYYGRELVSDPRYKELDIKHLSINNVFFQTELIPSGTTAGQYPDFGGFEDRFITVEINGMSHTLDNFTLTSSTITSSAITAVYEKDGIEIEKIMSTDGSAFKAEFKIKNHSGVDDKQIKFSAGFKPEYDGSYNISSSSGVPTGVTANQTEIPSSGTVFELSNDLVNYDFSFLNGGSYVKPNTLTTGSDILQSDNLGPNVITPTWETADLDDGAVLEFGIVLNHFNFKKDVYLVTNKTTSQIDSIIETVTTDITDVDYIPPRLDIQIGANENQSIIIPLFSVKLEGLGIANMSILPPAIPSESLAQADHAITRVTNYRTIYGALQNRLEHTANNLGNYAENLTAAESRIRDADMAKEMMDLTKSRILNQTAQAMLAQANQNPQAILHLFQ